MSSANAFSVMQPAYAALGIATFPVEIINQTKVPAIKGWQRIGQAGSEKLASGFPHAEMLGFCPGSRSQVTVLDIDSTDERVLADAVSRHGQTPLIVRTASKKFHAYYRHAGERRLVRPFPGLPIDLLGEGFVVAPPSVAPNRDRYQIIQGRLEDILALPPMREVDDLKTAEKEITARTKKGYRNTRLFSFSLKAAKVVDNAEELYARAMAENATYLPPLKDGEVLKTVKSAWRYETDGRNWVGCGRTVVFTSDQVDRLATEDGDAFCLLAVLKRHHTERAQFTLANAMAAKFGWGKNRFRKARKRLEQRREIRCLHSGGRSDNDPPIYAWR